MITSVKGVLEAVGPDWVAVAIGGVSLRVSVPTSTVGELGPVGREVRLSTYLQVKDDGLALFGFSNDEARRMFEMLLSISGVGPRSALNFLSAFATESLASAISSGDVEALSRVPGVGKKMASRIVLELKGKLEIEGIALPDVADDGEVTAALMALGYTAAEARVAISGLTTDGDVPLEERVRMALQRMAIS